MTTLELFCGTKSFSKVAAWLGHSVWTVDNDPQHSPDELVSVFDFTWTGGQVDVLWASPPCTAFSVASIGRHWTGGKRGYVPKTDSARMGLELLSKTIEIIEEVKPKYWFIENPRGMMRKMPQVRDLHRRTVTYCQYGDTRMKPTDIWTNFTEWESRPPCKNGAPCHVAAPRGSKTGTQGINGAVARGVIPPTLFRELFEQIEVRENTVSGRHKISENSRWIYNLEEGDK